MLPRHACRLALALVALLAAGVSRATAASKMKIAAAGDAAPGGGVFAGPGFSGWPTAAGNGWIAFRGRITGGRTSEAIIATRQAPPRTTVQVASKVQSAPGGGTFRQFFGRPAVNARGDVAFFALLTDPSVPDDPSLPVPAGVFLYDAATQTIAAVARSLETTAAGVLDVARSLDPSADPDAIDLPQRTPALNDLGDVSFLSALVPAGDTPEGAIFLWAPGGVLTPVLRFDDPFDGGHFVRLGPPALNATGLLAFHGVVSSSDASDAGADGIFAVHGADVSILAQEGFSPLPLNQRLTAFGDPIAVNDAGDVAFLAGPLVAPGDQSGADGVAGVLVRHAGVTRLAGYPGQQLPAGRVSDGVLSTVGGSVLAAPALAPDGTVTFFASIDGHRSEAIVRSDGITPAVLVRLGGTAADPTPTGGVYAAAGSAPAVDAGGGVAFLARISGGSTIEAIVYKPASGADTALVVGQAAPDSGFLAGPPFSEPAVNDGGDVVFRAFVAGGPSSVGIFRSRGGQLDAVARAGDPSPRSGAPFFDLVGGPSINAAGTVAFAAAVAGQGPGIYVVGPGGARAIVRGDPGPQGLTFLAFGLNPAVNEAGMVAFRAVAQLPTGDRQDGIFLTGPSDVRLLAAAGQPSPAGPNFLTMRDPVVTDVPGVFFSAPLGTTTPIGNGLFSSQVRGGTGIVAGSVAIERATTLADGSLITNLVSAPASDGAGDVAFGVRRSLPGGGSALPRDLGPAILRRTSSGLGLVVARGMPGPMGGTFKGFGQPVMGDAGHVAFFGSFNTQSPATPGFFLAAGTGIEAYVLTGETTPIGGHFQSFGIRPAANAHDEITFIGNVAGGSGRQGVFLASPTHLATDLAVKLSGGRARDRVRLRGFLQLGRLTNGVVPTRDGVALTLADASGRVLWSSDVPASALKHHGNRFQPDLDHRPALRGQVRALRLRVGKASIRVAAQSPPLDLTDHGTRQPETPFSLTVQIGDDSGRAVIPCRLGRRGGRCGV
ncbi:MAG: hypothetical protein E6J75_15610 [Deltaproteobacteria bacterium]|nr:MAG: hypothetical protein E6J75_15610 [Deltaproteobacteria bacterium]